MANGRLVRQARGSRLTLRQTTALRGGARDRVKRVGGPERRYGMGAAGCLGLCRHDFNGGAGCIEFKCCSGFADISRRGCSLFTLETSRSMKCISLLALWLCAATWASGCCCHSYYSRCADFDDGCDYASSGKRCKSRHARGERHGRRSKCDDDCCCDSCCCEGGNTGTVPQTYDGGPMMQGGGCSSGNCGTTSMPMTYGGMPFNPGDGWTLQSTTSRPVGEPVPAPSASSSPLVPIPATTSQGGWSAPSTAPVPAPVPPPVSYNR